jgi:hypothetical protein
MKKLQVLGLALFAVIAFGAVSVSVASAASVWLVDGAAPVAGTAMSTEGELALTDLTSLGEVTVDCSGILVGEFKSNTDILITAVLNLAGEAISSEPLVGLALSCTGLGLLTGTCSVWPEHLPWLAELELMVAPEPEWLIDLTEDTETATGLPAYHITCKTVIGTTAEDLCEGLVSGPLENMAAESDVLESFILSEQEADGELAPCTFTGSNTGHIEGLGSLVFVPGKTLALSEI